jgi:hypothetical protein
MAPEKVESQSPESKTLPAALSGRREVALEEKTPRPAWPSREWE